MDTKKILAAVGVALLALLPVASAQGVNLNGLQVRPLEAEFISNISTAVDTDPVLYVKYFGSGGAATTTMAVEADSNLTFVVDGAAYAGFECPVSGALGGIIDVSDAACDTLGEVVDVVNSTSTSFGTGYFRAVIAAGLRGDSSNATFIADAADTEVLRPEGDVVFWDTSALDDVQIGAWDYTKGIQNYISGKKLTPSPFEDETTVLLYGHENITNAGTITNTEVHCVVEKYKDGGLSTETDRVIYLEAAAATTATGLVNEFINAGGLACEGGKLFLRVLASGADTTAQTLFLNGYRYPRQK